MWRLDCEMREAGGTAPGLISFIGPRRRRWYSLLVSLSHFCRWRGVDDDDSRAYNRMILLISADTTISAVLSIIFYYRKQKKIRIQKRKFTYCCVHTEDEGQCCHDRKKHVLGANEFHCEAMLFLLFRNEMPRFSYRV